MSRMLRSGKFWRTIRSRENLIRLYYRTSGRLAEIIIALGTTAAPLTVEQFLVASRRRVHRPCLLADKLRVQHQDQTFLNHATDLGEDLPQLRFAIHRRDNHRLVVRHAEQPLVMDLLMHSESHDPGLDGR